MVLWRKMIRIGGRTLTFRQAHPQSQIRSVPGIYAFTQVRDFALELAWFKATNDLTEVLKTEDHPVRLALEKSGPVGLAVCVERRSTELERLRWSAMLNRDLYAEAA